MATPDLSQGKVSGQILRLALPMIGAQLINCLYNIVDRIYIGQMPGVGRLAITGVGVTLPMIMLFSAFASLAGMGGSPLCSMAWGEGNLDKGRKILGNVFTLLTLFGLGLMAVGYGFKEPILYLFGASADTYVYASDYISIYLLGSLPVMYALGLNSMISCQGFGKTAMLTVLLGAALNIALDPLFIFGFHMGVKGAAWATVISQTVSAVWVMRFLTGKKALIRLAPACMRLDWPLVKKICALGVSTFTMNVTESAVVIVFNAQLQLFGGDLYVGVMTVLNAIKQLTFLPQQGMAQGAIPVMSYNYGARAYKRVREGANYLTLACLVFGFAACAICLLFPGQLIRIFNSDAELICHGIPALRLYFLMTGVMALQMAGQNCFLALNRAKEAMFFATFRKVILLIPLVYLLPGPCKLGVMGVFIAEPIADFISSVTCYLTFRLTAWKKLKA